MSTIELTRRQRQPLIEELQLAGADCTKPASIRCPFHDDGSPSGSIHQKDGVWRYTCHTPACGVSGDVFDIRAARTGQRLEDVLRAERDGSGKAKPKAKASGPRVQVATYDYTDAAGVLVMQSIRYEPKDFSQRKPNGRGGWDWTVTDIKPWPLYRLPRIAETPADTVVYFVEGEKDADRLTAQGLVATSTVGGAAAKAQGCKAKSSDLKPLHGRHVVIIPDNDEAGRGHAEGVAALLKGYAASVKVLHLDGLPDKGDVSDWFDDGHDAEELDRLAVGCAEWTAEGSTGEDSREKPKKRKLIMRRGDTIDDDGITYLWRRRFAMGAMNVLFSRPGAGKSTIAADLAGHVTTGRAWPDGSPCPKGNVLYFKGEGADSAIRDRMKLAGADGTKYHIIGRADDPESPMVDLAEDWQLVRDALDEAGDVKLVIVDTLDSTFPSMRMIDNGNVRKCLFPLQELAEQRGFCVVILAHTNKGGYTDPLDRLSGARAIGGAARSVWYAGKVNREDTVCHLCYVKANDFLPAKSISYELVGMGGAESSAAVRWGSESELSAWDLDKPTKSDTPSKSEQCAEWLREQLADGPMPVSVIKERAKDEDYGGKAFPAARQELGVEVLSPRPPGWTLPVHFYALPGQTAPTLDADFDPTTYRPPSPPLGSKTEYQANNRTHHPGSTGGGVKNGHFAEYAESGVA